MRYCGGRASPEAWHEALFSGLASFVHKKHMVLEDGIAGPKKKTMKGNMRVVHADTTTTIFDQSRQGKRTTTRGTLRVIVLIDPQHCSLMISCGG